MFNKWVCKYIVLSKYFFLIFLHRISDSRLFLHSFIKKTHKYQHIINDMSIKNKSLIQWRHLVSLFWSSNLIEHKHAHMEIIAAADKRNLEIEMPLQWIYSNMGFKKPQTNSSLLKNSFLTADTHVCNFNSFYRSMELKVGIPWVFFYISIYSEIFYQPRYRFQLLLIQHDLTKKQIIFQKNLIVRNQNH